MIVFASDFGHADGYVGIVEAVIAGIAPSERIVHLAHDVAPQDLRAGSLVLWSAARHLPEATTVLAVIDPGVGGSRRAIAARGRKLVAIGPDNGLFGAMWSVDPPHQVCALARDPDVAARTFDARDVFGPAAARLAFGMPFEELGPLVDPGSLIAGPVLPTRAPHGEIWSFDRFGNAVTNLVAHVGGAIEIGDRRLVVRTHYAETASGEPIAYVGSSGLVEIAIRDGSARDGLGLRVAGPVRVVA